LHEAEKLLQSVDYSVDKQLAQDLKEIEDLKQELAKTEKRQQGLSLDIDQAQEILKELEDQLATTLASRRQLMIAQLQAELEDGQPCMVCGSIDHPKVDGTQANEAALKNLMDQVEELQAQKERQVATLSNRQATLSEVESKRQDLLDQVAKVKLTLEKHYQELQEQVKGQFDFDFAEDYEADCGQTILRKVEQYYQELLKRFDKEEADRLHYQDELAKVQEKSIDLAKAYQEAKVALDQAKERLKELQEAHPELESVEVYQERISLAKQELDLYNKQVKENSEAYNQLHADIQGIKGQLESLTKSKENASQETKRLSAELDQSLMAEGALTNDLEQIQLWLLEVNKQAIPKLQAQLTSYQTLKQELKAQIVKGQELIEDQEKPDLGNLTQAVEDCQESYDKQLAQVSIMEQGLKDATATYQAAKTLQDSNQEAFKAQYYSYIMNGLITQLARIKPNKQIEEAHMQNRALIAWWAYEIGKSDKVIELVQLPDGKAKALKTFVRINDYAALRQIFAQQLAEIQRVKSMGDFNRAKELVETYAVKVNKTLHNEVLSRYEQLNIAPYKGFINPVMKLEYGHNNQIVDVKLDYTETYTNQMMRYSKDYSLWQQEKHTIN